LDEWLHMTNPQFRFAKLENDSVRWMLARNCSITPRQLMGLYLSFCVIALCVGIGFWSQGAILVAPFAFLELVFLAIAFVVYARHARDAERIVLQNALLQVEIETAGRCVRVNFPRRSVRVSRDGRAASLIELSCKGQSVTVGRYIRPELREALAREMVTALRMT
jgi:uncharacterized membrane protein